jgi:hypothetical protein
VVREVLHGGLGKQTEKKHLRRTGFKSPSAGLLFLMQHRADRDRGGIRCNFAWIDTNGPPLRRIQMKPRQAVRVFIVACKPYGRPCSRLQRGLCRPS